MEKQSRLNNTPITDEILKSDMYIKLSESLTESELAAYELEIKKMISPLENIRNALLIKVSDKDGSEAFVDSLVRSMARMGKNNGKEG
jgi:hypothetical protein